MKNTEIESKLFELVKGCINNEDFMVNRKETGRHDYRCGGPRHVKLLTGVSINTTSVNIRYEEHGKCDYKQAYCISLDFEHEPSIHINYEIVKNEITIRNYRYVLTCGEFKVDLTDEQVEELVELYNTNIIAFKKNKQASEIISRMKKYIN